MQDSIILASASPQRQKLLLGLGLTFSVVPSRINEAACTEPDPKKRALLLAREKAQEVADRHRGQWIIGCDTFVVAHDGTLLEKPADAAEARAMMTLQSGGCSMVYSGLVLLSPTGVCEDGVSISAVHFRSLTPAEIDRWIASNIWRERSGAFQIDGPGQLLIERLEGDWTGVVGFPVYLFGELARKAGMELPSVAD